MASYFPMLLPIKRGLKSYFLTYLPTKLSELSVETGVSPLESPPGPDYIFIQDRLVIDRFPAMKILSDSGDFNDRIAAETVSDVDHRIPIITIITGSDPVLLGEQLDCYLRAECELLADMNDDESLRSLLGPKVFAVNLGRYQYLTPDSQQALIRAVWLEVVVRSREGH